MRIPLFENAKVRVWRTIIEPGEPLPMHHHEKPRVAVPLQNVNFKRVFESGKTQEVNFEVGQAYWEGAESEHDPHEVHAEVNDSDKAIEVVVVEIK